MLRTCSMAAPWIARSSSVPAFGDCLYLAGTQLSRLDHEDRKFSRGMNEGVRIGADSS